MTGVLTWTDVENYLKAPETLKENTGSIMTKDVITVEAGVKLSEAKAIMDKNGIHCLPVVHDKKLIGIITSNDIP